MSTNRREFLAGLGATIAGAAVVATSKGTEQKQEAKPLPKPKDVKRSADTAASIFLETVDFKIYDNAHHRDVVYTIKASAMVRMADSEWVHYPKDTILVEFCAHQGMGHGICRIPLEQYDEFANTFADWIGGLSPNDLEEAFLAADRRRGPPRPHNNHGPAPKDTLMVVFRTRYGKGSKPIAVPAHSLGKVRDAIFSIGKLAGNPEIIRRVWVQHKEMEEYRKSQEA